MPRKVTKQEPNHWLFKSEPNAYSIDDLAAESNKSTFWDGVRNYQARNILRDDVKKGDLVFFYHSNTEPIGIHGIMKVIKAGYPDHTAFDPQDHHYDAKSDPENPTWFMVDVKFVKKFKQPITRDLLKSTKTTSEMMVMQRGSRLSVQPVTPKQWEAVLKLAEK